jgi:hypothetical protein
VFDNDVVGWDATGLDAAGRLAAVEAKEHVLINAETRRFELAAHWADLHPGGSVPEVNCLWRSPPTHLRHKPDGTHPLGDTQFAQKIWQRNIGGSPGRGQRRRVTKITNDCSE